MAGFFSRLKEGLTKTRNNIVSGIDAVFGGFSTIDEDFYEELEEILIDQKTVEQGLTDAKTRADAILVE